MKTVNDVLSKMKGTDKPSEVVTGKGAFSQAGFADLVSAFANDTTAKIPTYDKNGNVTGEVCISQLLRDDLRKSVEKAKYPQKGEAAVFDTCEIVTTGLSKAIPQIVAQQMMAGKKFDIPTQEKFAGSIYLADVPGRTKETSVRDPKTQQNLGKVISKSEDSIQIRAKSPIPDHLQTKTRYDVSGKKISK